jgi:hypothetical protein
VYPRAPLPATVPPKDDDPAEFAQGFLDARVHMPDGQEEVLRRVLAQRFVYPIAREAEQIQSGGRLSGETPMSAIPVRTARHIEDRISQDHKWLS